MGIGNNDFIGGYGDGGYATAVGNSLHGSYSVRSVPDVSYVSDILTYLRHLYRQELDRRGLKGIGFNSFRLPASVNRDDEEICNEIVNKFNDNKMATKFEKRLHEALKEKERLDKENQRLKEKIPNKQYFEGSKSFNEEMFKYRKRVNESAKKLRMEAEQMAKDAQKSAGIYVKNVHPYDVVTGSTTPLNTRSTTSPPVQEKKQKISEWTDKDFINHYLEMNIFGKITNISKYQFDPLKLVRYGNEGDTKKIYITFIEPVTTNSTMLQIFKGLKPTISKYAEVKKSKPAFYKNEDDLLGTIMQQFEKVAIITAELLVMLFGKKQQPLIKEVCIDYNTVLKLSKEKYSKQNKKENE